MALDGITVAGIVSELRGKLAGARIDRVHQPYKDEIILGLRRPGESCKLLLSANPSHPRLHITGIQKENPAAAPMFTMVLRKHIAGGRILGISQPDFERIVYIDIEAANEMGDLSQKRLILEIMGKHSNIILCGDGKIIDSIKRISHDTSSVREVLPGRDYVLPPSGGKKNPLLLEKQEFMELLREKSGVKFQNFIYQSYTGISPVMASEICVRGGADPSACFEHSDAAGALFDAFSRTMDKVKREEFSPAIYYDETGAVRDFFVLRPMMLAGAKKREYPDISSLLEGFYAERDSVYNMRQRSHDLRKLVATHLERCVKKRELQLKTLKDTENMDQWKVKGELVTASIYRLKKGMTVFTAPDFHEEGAPETEIFLDANLTPAENAQRFFNKYNKAKRTKAALAVQLRESRETMEYLEGVLSSIDAAENERDLKEIRQELYAEGVLKKPKGAAKKEKNPGKTKPMHFVSSAGFDIYVGKSNSQNDFLTMKTARPGDMWLHAKEIPGSHVIISAEGKDLPDASLLEAAQLAAYYSRAKGSSGVPVDYTLRRYVKKPSGAKPGLVVYEKHSTLFVTPSEDAARRLPD